MRGKLTIPHDQGFQTPPGRSHKCKRLQGSQGKLRSGEDFGKWGAAPGNCGHVGIRREGRSIGIEPQTSPNFISPHHRSLLKHLSPNSCVLIFYCCITNCHKFNHLKQTYVLYHSSVGQKSRPSQLDSLLKVPQAEIKVLAGLSWGRSASMFILTVGRIQLLVVVGLRSPFAGCQLRAILSSLRTLPGPCTQPPPSAKLAKRVESSSCFQSH